MHRLAGTILEAEGATPEAMGAFARAEEWAEVTRLLREGGVNGQDTVARWLDTIPEHIALNDPWVRRGLARRLTVDGAFSHALSIYHDLKRQALDLRSDADLPEARLLESWTAPNVGRTVSWVDLLRAAIAGRPGEVADAAVPSGPVEQLATIGALLLAGRVGEAQDSLGRLVDAHGPVAEAVAVALEVCADILRDLDDPGDGIGVAARLAADANLPMLERLVGSLNALIGHPESAAVAAAMADEAGDEWGGALARLFGGLGSLLSGNPDPATLEKSAATFGALGASTLQCWADVLRELSSEAGAVLPGFEGIAKGTGPTLHALALVQLARTSERPVVLLDQAIAIANAAGTGFLVDSAARRCIEGFRTPPGSPTVDDAGAVGVPRLDVTWVGPLSLRLDGRPVDLTALRPIHRSLLKLIVVRAGAWVHREVLIEELWPERPPEQGFRNLQVGISAIRRMLEPSAPRGDSHLLERDGERYRLVIASFDLRTLEERVEHFDRSTRAGDDEGARVARAAIAELLHDEPLADADYLDTLETERNRLSMLTERIRSTG